MMKLTDEFFNNLERVFKPTIIFCLFMAILTIGFSYLVDMNQFKQALEKHAIKDFLLANQDKLISYGLIYFFMNLYALCGYWYCLMKKEVSSFLDFFVGSNTLFFKALAPYTLMNLFPLIFFGASLFLTYNKNFLFSLAILIMASIGLWLIIRLSLWMPAMFLGQKGIFSPLKESYRVTEGAMLEIFFLLLLPPIVLSNIVGGITWKFLSYFFIVFNSVLLPFIIEIIKLMLFIRLVKRAETIIEPEN